VTKVARISGGEVTFDITVRFSGSLLNAEGAIQALAAPL